MVFVKEDSAWCEYFHVYLDSNFQGMISKDMSHRELNWNLYHIPGLSSEDHTFFLICLNPTESPSHKDPKTRIRRIVYHCSRMYYTKYFEDAFSDSFKLPVAIVLLTKCLTKNVQFHELILTLLIHLTLREESFLKCFFWWVVQLENLVAHCDVFLMYIMTFRKVNFSSIVPKGDKMHITFSKLELITKLLINEFAIFWSQERL